MTSKAELKLKIFLFCIMMFLFSMHFKSLLAAAARNNSADKNYRSFFDSAASLAAPYYANCLQLSCLPSLSTRNLGLAFPTDILPVVINIYIFSVAWPFRFLCKRDRKFYFVNGAIYQRLKKCQYCPLNHPQRFQRYRDIRHRSIFVNVKKLVRLTSGPTSRMLTLETNSARKPSSSVPSM